MINDLKDFYKEDESYFEITNNENNKKTYEFNNEFNRKTINIQKKKYNKINIKHFKCKKIFKKRKNTL